MLRFLQLSNVLILIKIEKEEYFEAKKLAESRDVPLVDCINVIHARNHKAIMVSQDRHFLRDLKDITDTKRPEEIN